MRRTAAGAALDWTLAALCFPLVVAVLALAWLILCVKGLVVLVAPTAGNLFHLVASGTYRREPEPDPEEDL